MDIINKWKELELDYKKYLKNRYKIVSVNSKINSLNKYFEWKGLEEYKVKSFRVQTSTSVSNIITKNEYFRL
ncbi:hypothetical protein [Lachnospira multipara]|uniref:Phage integrase, N-terminal SAM-like domain n=1 Tax=Lachnospira multipara TaxID=28051 RepID=A0A1H5UZ77_9FIRM|nr:hypothetical protein [Lachnospira multipara]SEF80313.1 hypothetical protein SAMN05216537_10922 [Lachnospira multipara]